MRWLAFSHIKIETMRDDVPQIHAPGVASNSNERYDTAIATHDNT